MEHFLLQLFIFLLSAAIAVPVAKKLGLGSVLGYLIAGIVIGPFGLSLIGHVEEVMHFTEFGVVMMLFLVGLELKPSMLWKMRTPILGMGGLQVVLSALAIVGIGFFFLPWQQAVAVGAVLALSSTAIVLQTLKEKGLMNTPAGRSVFSVLLFQDLAVIPMLALLPLLANVPVHHDDHGESVMFDMSAMPGYVQLLITIAAILVVFFIGKFLSRPIFRAIAKTGVREIFVGAALCLVVGISLLMTMVGLSPALGTFLAGVVLADSEYRHELESDIEPFKGLLLGIFFISIGASLNFILIARDALLIGGITLGLIVVKWIVLNIIALIFRMKGKERRLLALSLAQGGEFAFVLFQFARTNGVLPEAVTEPLISAVAISMFLAPLLFILEEKLGNKGNKEAEEVRDETIDVAGKKVILAGFGRLGTDLGRFLISSGIKPVILDHDATNVDVLRKFGFEVYYGDITRLDLLEAAGADEAEMIVVTMSDVEISTKLIELVKKHYPHMKIAANSYDRSSVYRLMDYEVDRIRRETFGSALELGRDVLELLGTDPYEAYRMMRLFRKHDEAMMPELYKKLQEDEAGYVSLYRQQSTNLEELMQLDLNEDLESLDKAWSVMDPEK